ncbi:MAG TPA: hypothetical protein VMI52_12820 [Acetobacteraceae bacterium]|nr:hypothetical protein [Acetobacteraceae bacterium]
MHLVFVADYSATDFSKKASRALDAAVQGAVRVKRRDEVFVLLRERQLEEIVQDASDPRPKTLEDMITGYDAAEIKSRMSGWLADEPTGKEVL